MVWSVVTAVAAVVPAVAMLGIVVLGRRPETVRRLTCEVRLATVVVAGAVLQVGWYGAEVLLAGGGVPVGGGVLWLALVLVGGRLLRLARQQRSAVGDRVEAQARRDLAEWQADRSEVGR